MEKGWDCDYEKQNIFVAVNQVMVATAKLSKWW
jgi:hypothetical protein